MNSNLKLSLVIRSFKIYMGNVVKMVKTKQKGSKKKCTFFNCSLNFLPRT